MKKIIIAVILIVVFIPSLVFASSDKFYEGEYLPSAYIKKFKSGATTGKYEQMRLFRRVSDNTPAYCIELWENVSESEEMQSTGINIYNKLSNAVLEKIELYAYYGYGYLDHTDLDWYTATQFLIWKETSPDSNIYFTDSLNGNKVDKFIDEMNEINRLVNNHHILPSFHANTYEVGLTEEITLEDTNNVLSNFKVVTNYLYPSTINDNKLRIRNVHTGTVSIVLEKGLTTNLTQIYSSDNSQDLLVRGNYKQVKSYVRLKVTGGKIYLSKIDKDTNSYTSLGEASLDGTSYGLYNSKDQLVETIHIKSDGKAISKDLVYGTYYLKEKTTGIGYKLDENKYEVTVSKFSPTKYITLSNQVIKSTIEIHNSYKPLNTDKLYDQENTLFSFYNKSKEKVGEIKTDKDGNGKITLPYGTYTVIQDMTKENYKKIDNFTITIDENSSSLIKYELVNEEYGSSLKVLKIDKDSNLPIRLKEASFKIKNLNTTEYISYNDVSIFKTSNNGELVLPIKLGIGKYQLEEVEAPIGYRNNNEMVIFEINKDTGDLLELKVENEKEYGNLKIIKYGEKVTINNNKLEYKKELLSNVEYSLYADSDIVSGDGITHYKKGEFITKKITNLDGTIIFDNLLYGRYYVVESNCLDLYNIDINKYYIEINKDNLNQTLEKINTLKKGNIKINKFDSKSLLPIYNVEFEIYNYDNIKIDTLKTNQSGEIYITNLPLGKYYIKEVSAPFPYIIDKEVIEVELTDNDENILVNLKNDRQYLEIEIPNTGIEINNNTNNPILYFLNYILIVLSIIIKSIRGFI